MSSVVLVHGAWHGAWCWDGVVERLRAGGADVHTVDLPSNHTDGAGFTDDVAAVREILDGLSGAVLCGHSYGGAVISEAGTHDAVSHLVYLCAFALDVGESLFDNAAGRDPVASAAPPVALTGGIQVHDGVMVVDPEVARAAFYADCDVQPVDRLVPHHVSTFTARCTAAAWRDKPSTYVLCTQDQAIQPEVQRFLARRCTTTVELEASHSPMLSMPDRVASILTDVS